MGGLRKKKNQQILDPIVLVVKFPLFTVFLFSRDRKELTIMGAKIMSQGGGLRGILLIVGEEKELQEMEGSGLGGNTSSFCACKHKCLPWYLESV